MQKKKLRMYLFFLVCLGFLAVMWLLPEGHRDGEMGFQYQPEREESLGSEKPMPTAQYAGKGEEMFRDDDPDFARPDAGYDQYDEEEPEEVSEEPPGGLVIEGSVVDESENGIEGAQLLKVFGMKISFADFQRTDEYGEFRIRMEKLDPATLKSTLYLVVYHPEYSYKIAKLPPPTDGKISGVRVVLPKGQVISGVLTDARGNVLDLRPLGLYLKEIPTEPLARVQTDSDGYFEFTGIPPGAYSLTFLPGMKFADIHIESRSDLEHVELVYDEEENERICCTQEIMKRVYGVEIFPSQEDNKKNK